MATNGKNGTMASPGHSRSNTASGTNTPQESGAGSTGKMTKSGSPSQITSNPSGRVQTPQEFEFETRLVVLNFLGLVPQHQVGSSSGSGSLNSSLKSTSGESRSRKSYHSQTSKASLGSVSPARPPLDHAYSTDAQSHLQRYLSVQRERTETESTLRKSSGEFEPHDDIEDMYSDSETMENDGFRESATSPGSSGSGGVVSPLDSVKEFGKRSGSFSSISSEKTVVLVKESGEEADRPSRPSSLIFTGSGSPDDSVYSNLFGIGETERNHSSPKDLQEQSLDNSQVFENSGKAIKSPQTQEKLPPMWGTQETKEHQAAGDFNQDSSTINKTDNLHQYPEGEGKSVPTVLSGAGTSHSQSGMIPIPEGKPAGSGQKAGVPERQHSVSSSCSISIDLSTPVSDISSLQWSFRSRPSSRTSFVDVTQIQDIYSLVKASALPAVVVPLREELEREYSNLERDYQEVMKKDDMSASPISSAPSPESEVAYRLGLIGDVVQQEFFGPLTQATQEIINQPTEAVDYEVFCQAAQDEGLIGPQVVGWKQVALLMLFGQKVTYSLLQRGDRHLGRLADYTVKLIEDKAADFIIKQGGWLIDFTAPEYEFKISKTAVHHEQSAVSELEIESPVSVSDVMPAFPPDDSGSPSSVDDSTFNTSNLSVIPGTPASVDGIISPQLEMSPQHGRNKQPNNDVNANVSNREAANKLPRGQESLDSGLGDGRVAIDTPDSDLVGDDVIKKVQREIQLIRQASSELSEDHGIEPDEFAMLRLGLYVASAAFLGAFMAFVYRKYCRSR